MARDLERHGVELELLDGPEVPSVLVDPGQVRQAVFNLVRNAREAMPEGGRISVAVVLGEDSVDVSVADNGPGISPERVSQLFDPFYTTKDHGTGLGLAVTRQIMLSHGGRLEYRSGTPGGSVFTLSFPTGTSDVPSADGRADTEDTVPFATDEKGRGEG
jgi:signal transduction histidine kinase